MSKNFQIIDETTEYNTAANPTNTDERTLVAGSRNMLIDRQRKVRSRNGNTIFGGYNSAVTGNRQGLTWNTSTGTELKIKAYDDELVVYFGTVDGVVLNAFYRIEDGWSTTVKPRFTTWYKDTEKIDVLVFVYGDDNLYEWNGAVCVVDSVTATTITKEGTDTFAQNRFYTVGSKVLVNIRTGTEYTYTGGESTTTLTGIADTTGIIAGDVLIQKIITQTDKPSAGRNNHTIFTFENQICVGSDDDQVVYVSQNDDYTDFTYSAPRTPGQGALLTLDNPAKGFGILLEALVVFAGKSSIYQVTPEEITVSTTLAEIFKVKKYQTGIGQSAQSQEVITPIGSTLVYLSFEPAVRELVSLEEIQGGGAPRTLSNPIKPDMDAEDWTDACGFYFQNSYLLSAPTNGRVYIQEYVEDADGKLRRFWQSPQTMFIGAWSTIDNVLYGDSSATPETLKIFDSTAFSDENSDAEKTPIHYVAKFAYRGFKERALLKNFDEYFVEGEISPSTDILLTLNYNYGGALQSIERTIEGDDYDILLETLENTSLGQQPLGQEPLGGSISAPTNTAKFNVIFEIAKEDFTEIQDTYEVNDVDKYFAIIARGPNAQVSKRQNTIIKK